jgi:hypothetical protein
MCRGWDSGPIRSRGYEPTPCRGLGSGLELSLFTCPSPWRAALHFSHRSPRERDDETPASFCRGSDSYFTLQVLLFPQPRGRRNRTHDFLHQCGHVGLCETAARRWYAVVLDVGWDRLVVWRGTGQLRDMSKQRCQAPFDSTICLIKRLQRFLNCPTILS